MRCLIGLIVCSPTRRCIVQVEPLIPHDVLATIPWSNETSVDDICAALEQHDSTFRQRFYEPAMEQHKRLHYVASIDLSRFPIINAEVKPAVIDESHPAFYTRNNEIAFGFSTLQYQVRRFFIGLAASTYYLKCDFCSAAESAGAQRLGLGGDRERHRCAARRTYDPQHPQRQEHPRVERLLMLLSPLALQPSGPSYSAATRCEFHVAYCMLIAASPFRPRGVRRAVGSLDVPLDDICALSSQYIQLLPCDDGKSFRLNWPLTINATASTPASIKALPHRNSRPNSPHSA